MGFFTLKRTRITPSVFSPALEMQYCSSDDQSVIQAIPQRPVLFSEYEKLSLGILLLEF